MSAVILLVVVVAWAVVMVPFLLRRHDEVTESRSVDDFEKSMRVLSRRSQAVEASRQVVVPRRSGRSTAVTVTANGTTRLADGPAAAREALLRTRAAVSVSNAPTPAIDRITAPVEPPAESTPGTAEKQSATHDESEAAGQDAKPRRSRLFRSRHDDATPAARTTGAPRSRQLARRRDDDATAAARTSGDPRSRQLARRRDDDATAAARTSGDPRSRQLVRCRRTVLMLAALPILGLALALLVSPWFWLVQGLADAAVLAFVVHVRQESARAVARRRHQAERVRRARERDNVPELRPAYARAAAVPAHLTAGRGEVVIEKQSDGTWTPVPVPVPTYVTAPRAPRTPAERPAAETQVAPQEDARTVAVEEPERRKAAGE